MKLLSLLAKAIGWFIQRDPFLFNQYQLIDFRGKQLIAQYVTKFPENGQYIVTGIKYDLDFNDEIQKQIYLNTYERHDKRLLKGLLQPGWLCLDVGANIGFYSLLFAKENCFVHSFEPSPVVFQKLKHNITLNGLDGLCSVHQKALSSKSGTDTFLISSLQNSGWGKIGEHGEDNKKISVKIDSLDNWIAHSNIRSIDLIKIDIEGHEFDFLEGAKETLKKGIIKRIFVEYSGFIWEQKRVAVEEFVQPILDHGFTDHPSNVVKYGIVDPLATYNLLFIHRSVSV